MKNAYCNEIIWVRGIPCRAVSFYAGGRKLTVDQEVGG
jgi:hypothetical protein